MNHSFDIDIAKDYGIEEAILLNHLYFWIEKNKANNKCFYNETYWTYSTKKGLAILFPYMTTRKIDYALKNLIDKDLIETGNFNTDGRDRTLWYSITNKGYCILQNCKLQNTKSLDELKDINNSKDISNEDINNNSPIPYKEVVEYLNEKTNKNFRYQSTATQRLIKARFNEGFTLEDFKKVIDTKCADWLNDEKMVEYLRPETLFSNKFEGYLNSAKQKPTSKKLGFYA